MKTHILKIGSFILFCGILIALFLPNDSAKLSKKQNAIFKKISLSDDELTNVTQNFVKALLSGTPFESAQQSQTLKNHTEPTLIKATVIRQNLKKNYTAEGQGCLDTLQTLATKLGSQKIEAIKIEFVKNSDPLLNASFYATANEFHKLYRNHRVITDLTKEIVSDTTQQATAYLLEHIQANGKFDYIFNPSTGKIPKKYNLVRHAGTLYALLDAYIQQPNAEHLAKIKLGIDYLLDKTQACPANGLSLCVVEDAKVKLGGNALALVALAKYTQVTHDTQYLVSMQGLANAIVLMQEANGHFISDWAISNWQDTGFVSEYYPGEATLGLLELYKVDPNPLWLTTARKATDYIALTRDKNLTPKNVIHDHWMLIAINQLHRVDPQPQDLAHAKKIVLGIQQAQIQGSKILDYNGGYYNPPRSTPAAVRTEGLIAAYHLFTDYDDREFAKTILPTVEKNLRFQIQTRVFPETTLSFQKINTGLGGFQKSVTESEIRIDYVQHNLSGFLGYLRILEAQ